MEARLCHILQSQDGACGFKNFKGRESLEDDPVWSIPCQCSLEMISLAFTAIKQYDR